MPSFSGTQTSCKSRPSFLTFSQFSQQNTCNFYGVSWSVFHCNIISGGFVLRKHFFTRTLFCSVTKNGEAESSKYLEHNTPLACYSIIKYYPCKERKFFFFFFVFFLSFLWLFFFFFCGCFLEFLVIVFYLLMRNIH